MNTSTGAPCHTHNGTSRSTGASAVPAMVPVQVWILVPLPDSHEGMSNGTGDPVMTMTTSMSTGVPNVPMTATLRETILVPLSCNSNWYEY